MNKLILTVFSSEQRKELEVHCIRSTPTGAVITQCCPTLDFECIQPFEPLLFHLTGSTSHCTMLSLDSVSVNHLNSDTW